MEKRIEVALFLKTTRMVSPTSARSTGAEHAEMLPLGRAWLEPWRIVSSVYSRYIALR